MNFLLLIKVFFKYSLYKEYREYLSITKDMKEIYYLFKALDNIYTHIQTDITYYDYALWVQTNLGKDYEIFLKVLEKENLSEAIIEQTLSTAKTHAISLQIAQKAILVSEGKLSYLELMEFLNKEKPPETKTKHVPITNNLTELLDMYVTKPGYRWRLDCLNKSLGSLRDGDFGFIFARPEMGKTTFLASEITNMATQFNRPVIWINNEEQGGKVKLRLMQAFFGIKKEELVNKKEYYEKTYIKTIGHKLFLFDDASFAKRDIEAICNEYNPGLLVIDQLHKIKGFDSDREDLRLGQVFGWGRELAKQYKQAIIGVNQADNSAENKRYLTMENVANAKTAIQAEADWILGIGGIHDVGYEFVRFLNISKNKLTGDPDTETTLRHGRFEVLINPDIGRYYA